MYAGLPPGPINFPEPAYLERGAQRGESTASSSCARGRTLAVITRLPQTNREHERNARRYRKALDAQGVYK